MHSPSPFYELMTLHQARVELRKLVEEGHECPCCTLFAKVYKHKCDSAMARTLIRMYHAGAEDEHIHVPSLPGDNHKVSQLSWWGLVEEEKVRRPDGGRAGWWQITQRGIAFVLNRSTITKYARIYDARVLGYQGDPVSIVDCLGDRFDYRELMGQ